MEGLRIGGTFSGRKATEHTKANKGWSSQETPIILRTTSSIDCNEVRRRDETEISIKEAEVTSIKSSAISATNPADQVRANAGRSKRLFEDGMYSDDEDEKKSCGGETISTI